MVELEQGLQDKLVKFQARESLKLLIEKRIVECKRFGASQTHVQDLDYILNQLKEIDSL